MALDATVGGADSNSYITQADATLYFANRLYAANWTAAATGLKDQALMTATARIDQENFTGYRVTNTQALKWPRSWVLVPGEPYANYYATDEIPKLIKDAVCELALSLLASDTLAPTGLENFKSVSVGPISIEMNQPVNSGILPDQVSRLLRGLRVGSSGAMMVRA